MALAQREANSSKAMASSAIVALPMHYARLGFVAQALTQQVAINMADAGSILGSFRVGNVRNGSKADYSLTAGMGGKRTLLAIGIAVVRICAMTARKSGGQGARSD